jgi:hypothetical protein
VAVPPAVTTTATATGSTIAPDNTARNISCVVFGILVGAITGVNLIVMFLFLNYYSHDYNVIIIY